MRRSQRYLVRFFSTVAASLTMGAAINILVDPYGVLGSPTVMGINEIKTRAREREAIAKLHSLERGAYRALIVGNSRAELGFDPDHPSWPSEAQPVYNAAIPGTGFETSERVLGYGIDRGEVMLAVIGLDFLDFRVHPGEDLRIAERGVLQTAEARWRNRFETAFTLNALFDSVATVLTQRDRYAPRLTTAGFNPMHDYELIARRDGYNAMFKQRDIENAKAYLRGPKTVFSTGTRSSPALLRFERMARQCALKRIACHFVIYPYHTHILVLFQETGLWNAFWDWKEALHEIVERVNSHPVAVTLWDFSGPSSETMEPVPPKDQPSQSMRWYWEAGHFKKELGDRVLNQVLDPGRPSTELGERLQASNLPQLRTGAERKIERYRQESSDEVRVLIDIVRVVERSRG